MVDINEENTTLTDYEELSSMSFVDSDEEIIAEEVNNDPVEDSASEDKLNDDTVSEEVVPEGEPEVTSDDTAPVVEEWKPLSVDEQKALIAEREALAKNVAEKQKLIDRQGNELGGYRKSIREVEEKIKITLTEEEESMLDEIEYEEGKTARILATNELAKKKETEAREKLKEERDTLFQENYDKNMVSLKEYVPDFDSLKDTIKDILVSEGIPNDVAVSAVEYPGTEDPFLMKQLANRAREKVNVSNAMTELENLRAENAMLKEGIKKGSKTLLADIERASRIPPTITNSSAKKPTKQKPGSFENTEPTYEELSSINFVDD